MGALTHSTSKSLLFVTENRSPMIHHLETLTTLPHIKKITIVVGHADTEVKAACSTSYNGIPLTYVKNNAYKTTGSGYSLSLALAQQIQPPYLFMDADIFYESEMLHEFSLIAKDSLLASKREAYDDEMVKITTQGANLCKLNKAETDNLSGESVGMVMVHTPQFHAHIMQEAQQRAEQPRYEWEEVIENIAQNHPLHVSFTQRTWTEIDFPQDLTLAKKLFSYQK